MKILKGFTFNTRPRLCLMENLSNRFALRTKFLITIFQKWFKDTQKKIVEVQINGALEIGHEEKTKTSDQFQSVSQSRTDTPVRIWVDIRISNGLHLSQKNLSYPDLVRMVEKLEGLC